MLQDNERYLLIRRAAGLARAGCWCFPGGHVEAGETSRQAIQRELAEELGIDVPANKLLGRIPVPGTDYLLDVWTVKYDRQPIRPTEAEVAEARWLTPEQIRAITPAIETNDRVMELLARR